MSRLVVVSGGGPAQGCGRWPGRGVDALSSTGGLRWADDRQRGASRCASIEQAGNVTLLATVDLSTDDHAGYLGYSSRLW
jgi:hypothetical protein